MCTESRVSGTAGLLELGGTLSRQFRLGASAGIWTRHETNVTQSLAALTAIVRYYPWWRLHLLAGLGVSTRQVKTLSTGATSENGTAAVLGVGYDVPVSRTLTLTPFANVIGVDFSGQGTAFTQLGLALSVY
jgi:hypothetical protein